MKGPHLASRFSPPDFYAYPIRNLRLIETVYVGCYISTGLGGSADIFFSLGVALILYKINSGFDEYLYAAYLLSENLLQK